MAWIDTFNAAWRTISGESKQSMNMQDLIQYEMYLRLSQICSEFIFI